MSKKPKRFRVALSFPGERREFVKEVAELLVQKFGDKGHVLYDHFHEAEFARPNLDVHLPNLYRTESELIAVFLCDQYATKRWCKLEWRFIRQLLSTVDEDRIMFLSFDDIGAVPELGILTGDGYVSIGQRKPQEIADLILERLQPKAPVLPSNFPLHQLPPPPTAFTGREADIAFLEKHLATGEGAAIYGKHAGLRGTGGVGKTALALVLAHRLKARCPDAQLFLNLRGAGADQSGHYHGANLKAVTPVEAMQIIIHCFRPDARLPETRDELAPIYHSILSGAGRVLLVLDNAADAAQIQPLLPPANCLLLVTSRAKINLTGLATRDIDCLPPGKSQELLLNLAPRITGQEAAAAELCGHLPLALEVFAGAVNDRSLTPVSELIDRLRQRKETLSSVDAAFQVSFELLPEPLRRCWTQLGVFPAGFDLAAAAAVWEMGSEPAREALQALLNASLVDMNESKHRFCLHDLVRQFCAGKLSKSEDEAARFRHARHFRNIGAAADDLLIQGRAKVVEGLQLFDREIKNIEAAFEWLHTRKDKASAALLISLVGAIVHTGQDLRFHPRQRIRWLESQRAAARTAHDRQAEGVALGNLGTAYADLGEPRKAIEYHEQALAIDRAIGDRQGEGQDLGNLGLAYADLGEPRKAIEFYEQALVIDREIGDRRGDGNALGNLGNAYADLGEPRKAIEFYEQHLALAREIGDRRGEGNVLGNLGNAYFILGEPRKAIEYHEQALVIDREIGDRRGEGQDLGNLGAAYAALGEPRKAIEFYEKQMVIVRDIGDRRGEGTALFNSALALFGFGEKAEAIRRAEAALAIFEAIEDPNAAQVRAQLAAWRGEGSKP